MGKKDTLILETTKSRNKRTPSAKMKPVTGHGTIIIRSPPPIGTRNFTTEVSVLSIWLSVSPLSDKNFKQATQDGPEPATISTSESCGPRPLLTDEARLLGHSAGRPGVGISLSSCLSGCHFLFYFICN